MEKYQEPVKGRGAQINTPNPYAGQHYDTEVEDGLDEAWMPGKQTEVFEEHARKIINKVSSPDIPLPYSMNPYQGCEHGCIYCYARTTHSYWGFSAGLDFERKLIVKKNAADLLKKTFDKPSWEPMPIMFSGNTDCYQPLERKLEITRKCLKVFAAYRHPVGLITKNSLILRDLDILKDLARDQLVSVFVSITTQKPELRRKMEPRTATTAQRWGVIETLARESIPVGIMVGPVIPGLNNEEIPELLEKAASLGASGAGYSLVRLNGALQEIFSQWIYTHFPDRAEKVLNQIRSCHEGQLGEHRFGHRMRGSGALAESIASLFALSKQRFFKDKKMPPLNLEAFRRPFSQLNLFEELP